MHDNVNYLLNYGWRPTSKGKEYLGNCPFGYRHTGGKDNNPSFRINIETGYFYCQSCKAGGKSLVTLVMHLYNLDKEAAMKELGIRTNNDSLRVNNEELLNEVVELSTRCIERDNPKTAVRRTNVLKYLEDRNITPNMVDAYKIGYGHPAIGLRMRTKYYPDVISKSNIFGLTSFLPENRLVIPFYSYGRLIGLSCRKMYGGDTFPKYINCYNKELHPDSTWLAGIESGKEIFIVEGIFDVIRLKEYGYNAAGLLGTHITPERAGLIQNFDTIYICLDADAPGRKACQKFLFGTGGKLSGKNIKVINLPEGKDPDTMTKDEFDTAIKKSKHIFEWLLDTFVERVHPEKFLFGMKNIRKEVQKLPDYDRRIYNAMMDTMIEEYSIDIRRFYEAKAGTYFKSYTDEKTVDRRELCLNSEQEV